MVNSSKNFTLFVDGACRGNPGIGGWGALIINNDDKKQVVELYNGDTDTTNNRMELTAAIEGIKACPQDAFLKIYTDSSYVQKGITEWIDNWKKKQWKGVKNPDLWQILDQVCQNRNIEWHWIKGHAGHEGNERADQLANLGADLITKKKPENDWILSDPFGLDDGENFDIEETDMDDSSLSDINTSSSSSEISTEHSKHNDNLTTSNPSNNPHIVITPATQSQHGERLLILDTETTGFYYQDGDRIIEVGAIEMINRRLTGSSIHIYINPEKAVGESENIHGISDDFLKDKPKFKEIAQTLFDYLQGAEIVAHNATFDMNFLNAEFERTGLGKLSKVCSVTDTLALAKQKHPGQKNSLDALVKRYEIPARDRTFHGALLDAEILADVYLAMTGGQVSLDIDANQFEHTAHNSLNSLQAQSIDTPVILPTPSELDAHQNWLKKYAEKNEQPALFAQFENS